MKKYKIKVRGTEYSVEINSIEGNVASLTVNDTPYEVEVEGIATNPTRVVNKGLQKAEMQSEVPVIKQAAPSTGTAYPLKSPLPGVILDMKVKEGDTIKAGQLVLLLEAMKMENNIESDRDGIVEKVNFHKGDSVLEGDVLITIK
jgi:Acetyl/propionyl-CoA carboxylase, alpha subunit